MPTEDWWTAPAEADSGRLIMVTGRTDIDKFRTNPRYGIRVEVSWPYTGDVSGMPVEADAQLMEQVQEALTDTFRRDPVAVMVGVITGDDLRQWIFYTTSTHIFGRKLNEALADLPMLPLQVYCENDPIWGAYAEIAALEIQ